MFCYFLNFCRVYCGYPKMKKKILVIGNTDELPSVPVSIDSYCSFFTSPIGGNWRCDEIDIVLNPTKRSLFKTINAIEKADCDFVITIYLGHGCEVDGETVLIINEREETILMRDLTNLSQKQLTIVECCREIVHKPIDLAFTQAEATVSRLSMLHDTIRQAYENRILACPPQEIVLFACDTDESAKGTSEGGRYSQNLLQAAQTMFVDSHSPFVSVSRVHKKAVLLMQAKLCLQQHPQIHQSRCPINRRLPFVVNSSLWGIYDLVWAILSRCSYTRMCTVKVINCKHDIFE